MNHATMSYAQLLEAYQALQEHVIALEGAAAVQQSAQAWGHEAQHPALTRETVTVPEACLAGGGEMGKRIREHDWSATPLGPVEMWPQSLRSAVSILLPSKAQIVLFWGPELITIYNDAYAPVFGAKHPWALGRPARECWSEVWHVIGPLFEGVVRTGEAFWAKDHPFFLHRQGFLEETYFDVSYDPVRIEDGSVGGVFCIVNEQTGRVLGERRLRTLRELGTRTAGAKSAEEVCREAAAALAMDPADVPFSLLYLIDGPGRRAERVSVVGAELDDLVSGRDIVIADVDALASTCEGRAAEAETEVFVIRAPETAAARVLVLPISSGTQIVGALVAGVSRFLLLAGDYRDFFDLAAARISAAIANARAYEEERRRAEALAELDRAKTAFFSNVSHEFRTPLTLMLGPVEDILAKPKEQVFPENRELLTVAHRNGLRLQKLVNTLLDFSRIEAGRVQVVYEPTDLATMTADLASVFRSACERAGLRLVVDCPPLPEPVYVDREMWEKIVLNLLSNAFKFTFEGEIAVTLQPAAEAVELAVHDTGTGIPAAEIPHLFERFHRVAGARGRTHEGTGIGLALVRELAQLHGGSVRVESTPGRGSTFIVSIPTGTAHLPTDRIGGARTLASTALGASPYIEEALRWLPDVEPLPLTPLGSGAGLDAVPARPPPARPFPALHGAERESSGRARIVWADDNADMRDYVRRLLGARYDVEAVADGEAALAAASARRPDLVLADVMMPRLDGFGVLRALRADPETCTLPVILLSARAGEESRIEGLEAGADAYLVKPFSARELLAHVEAHLELGRVRARLEQERAALAELFRQTPVPIAVLRGPELVYDLANPAYLQVVGGRDIVGKPLLDALPEFQGQGFDQLLRSVMQTGVAHVGHEALIKLDRQGTGAVEDTYWTFIYAPLQGDSGQVERVIAISSDVTEPVRARKELEILAAEVTAELTERKRVEQALREQTEVVEAINRVGQTLAAELDMQKLVQAVTDAATALTGAKFGAFFSNVSEARGESYMFYALSGVPREQFAQFPIPCNTALFEPTFRGTGVVRSADVKQDPRYGKNAPHYSLLPGHLPVTSYLAVPVISRAGEVLGGLFFGHPEAGVFTERHERLVVGLAAQAAVALDNARLFAAAQYEIAERKQLEGVLREREQQYRQLVHALPAALYTCDAQGRVMLYNEAAVALWGRTPTVGKDLWCGSWQIYKPDGTPLPLDQCPMAVAIREGRSVRGQEIVIERPDGTRRYVLPYPEPIRNTLGEVIGAVNMLVDLTERKQAEETRERLAAIVDSSDDAIIGQTLDGLITSWNRGAEQLYGYTAAEVLGQPLSLLIPPDLPDDFPQLLGHLQRGEGIDHYETQRLHRNGTRRDVSLTISPIRDSAGRIVGASKIARDISERKRAEAALQQARATLEQRVLERTALLELMRDITRASNESPRSAEALQYALDRICTYTGWPVGHVYLAVAAGADRWASTALWHLDAPERSTAFQQAMQSMEFAVGEGLIGRVGASGQPEWCVDVAIDPTFHRRSAALTAGLKAGMAVPILVGSAVVGVMEFYTDKPLAPEPALLDAITQMGTQLGRAVEREWAAEQQQRQQEALLQREKLAAMSTILASVAHELNNPLASIVLQAELLQEDLRDSPLAEPATEITQAAARCERLVRQFLTLARQHPPQRTAVAFNTLVAETAELLAYTFTVDNVAVHLHLDDQVPPLWGDPHQLQQVLINLLTNAQQALRAAPGRREVTLTTQYDPERHQIALEVIDTGPGIPPALHARIFEPFFTTKPPGVGTGLGLPLCQGIVEAHGGLLGVTSELGHGATFRITLPVRAVPATPPAPPGAAEGPTVRGHTILIVEDERILATGLARLLRRDGHTVDMAANGRLALAMLDERAYDLILCDVRMPEMDGPSFYRFLERQHPHLCQRLLFLTGDTLEPATQAFLEQSGALCLTKPFTSAEARRAIQRAL